MSFAPGLDVVRSAVRAFAAARSPGPVAEAGAAAQRVVTISRQRGTDAPAVASRLAEVLSAKEGGPETVPWIAYDRALVERVAEDHNVSRDLVASMDEHDKTWFEHFTAGLAGHPTGTDIALKTAETIRGLARVGRSIIVGRGSQCILSETTGAVHARLVAPLEWRVAVHARLAGMSEQDAEKVVEGIDRERADFVRAHFHRDVADPTLYTVVLNRARLSVEETVDVIAGLVTGRSLDHRP